MTPVPRPGGSAVISWPDLDGAACKGADLNLFFGRDPEPGADLAAFAAAEAVREAEAKAICTRCPVRAECSQYAAASGQRWGIWGGVDRERTRPAIPDPLALCGRGLHLMTPDNAKPLAGTSQIRCRECQRDSDRRTAPARRARNAEARNARDRARYAEQVRQQQEKKAS